MTVLRVADRQYRFKRADVINRLAARSKIDRAIAEAWIASWERRAQVIGMWHGSRHFWDAALRWIAERRGTE